MLSKFVSNDFEFFSFELNCSAFLLDFFSALLLVLVIFAFALEAWSERPFFVHRMHVRDEGDQEHKKTDFRDNELDEKDHAHVARCCRC